MDSHQTIGPTVNFLNYLPTFQYPHVNLDAYKNAKPETDDNDKTRIRKMMMMKTSLVCLSLVLLSFLVAEGSLLGGLKPIKDVSDPNVVEIAKYAISEHNRQSKANLVYEKVVEGKEQVVSGTKYHLTIAAKNGGGATKNYQAIVWDKPWEHFRSLESFKAV